ncbi:biotin--[acetyl-CoA-carboxylase] ligase [Dokdonella sp.]|uniref:biotin--[acetyl-CoA-carboxylase] ligase n=1 Tax=Dokdonella sp. TaxID=2291710 RepID=UPI00352947FB
MSIEAKQLLALLQVDKTISGSVLAARFGVTRAAIWKQIESLRSHGAPIGVQTGKGYALQSRVEQLDARLIAAGLPAELALDAADIDVCWQIDSTSSELARRVSAECASPRVCFAEIQTGGRGRRGRSWYSPLGGGLAFSILWKFERSMSTLAGLSLVVGIGVVRALRDFGYVDAGLKWPNDVQIRRRKLAGILVELGGDALGPCHAIAGIGINVRLGEPAQEFIDQAWIDLASARRESVPERNALAGRLLARVLEAVEQFRNTTFSSFKKEFAQYDVLRGHSVRVSTARGFREGVAVGVDDSGALRVSTTNGELVVDSGEVSIRIRSEVQP